MLQQMAKDKYSIETLRELNASYDREHWLTQDDVDMANNYVQLIERTRSEITPQVGDRVVYVTECSREIGIIKSWYGASVMKTVLSRKTNGIKLMNRLLNGDSISILNKSR